MSASAYSSFAASLLHGCRWQATEADYACACGVLFWNRAPAVAYALRSYCLFWPPDTTLSLAFIMRCPYACELTAQRAYVHTVLLRIFVSTIMSPLAAASAMYQHIAGGHVGRYWKQNW